MHLKDRVQMSLNRRTGQVILRSELAELGGSSQLSSALRSLIQDGKLLRLGSGIYAKARKDSLGHVHLAGKPEQIVKEVFKKLGDKAQLVQVEAKGDHDLYWMDGAGHRVARKLEIGTGRVRYINSRSRPLAAGISQIPQDLEMLPKNGVSAFVKRFAQTHNVIYKRSRFDDWSESVTRAAGDDVRLDQTEKLLVALKKRNLINGRQAARLLTNHIREAANVRPVSRLRDGRLSPQHRRT